MRNNKKGRWRIKITHCVARLGSKRRFVLEKWRMRIIQSIAWLDSKWKMKIRQILVLCIHIRNPKVYMRRLKMDRGQMIIIYSEAWTEPTRKLRKVKWRMRITRSIPWPDRKWRMGI